MRSLISSDPKIASSDDAEFLKNASDLELCLLGKRKLETERKSSIQNYEVLETLKISTPIEREIITRTVVDSIHTGKNAPIAKAQASRTLGNEKFRPSYAVKARPLQV